LVGAVVGAVVGAAAPLAFAAYQYYQEIPKITTEALYLHSQCGPLSMHGVPRSRAPLFINSVQSRAAQSLMHKP
jgi:hypothetical protein